MAPKYKLIYFNGRGRAEAIRFLFAHAGVEYEDYRIQREDWPALKPKIEYGQLPVLEIDGKPFGQSGAIGRYLARKFGLDGKDDLERLQIEVIGEHVMDVTNAYGQVFREQDPTLKAEKNKKFMEETLPFYMSRFESTVKENGGVAVGKSISFIDIVLALLIESMEMRLKDEAHMSKYPSLKALQTKVFGLPGIKDYLKKRPVTEF